MAPKHMSNQDPAFPLNELNQTTGDICAQHFGMTLRDYFAAQLLPSIYSAVLSEIYTSSWRDALAKTAYSIADAMMLAREDRQ